MCRQERVEWLVSSLRFRYSDLKLLLLKAYILTRLRVFLFIFGDHMLMGS